MRDLRRGANHAGIYLDPIPMNPVAIQMGDRRVYPPATVPALAAFLDELAEKRVRYCLWKSNLRLADALAGATDLDLLVDRRHAAVFREIVGRHRLNPLVPPVEGRYPGMEHFLGLDMASGRLFHLHVHYQLVLGEEYVKNYRLPIEEELLASTRLLHRVPIPRPELELSILAVRALLKYRDRDVVKDLLRIRSPGLPEQVRAEMGWLLTQTTVEEVRAALQAIDSVVPADVVCEFLETAVGDPRSGYSLFLLRRRLRRAVAGLRRRSRLRASLKYHGTAWRRRARRPRMTRVGGGLTIALVGADGSGKSTMAEALARWLSWKLEVRVCYLGSKAPSRRSRWLYVAFRALRRSHRATVRKLGSEPTVARSIGAARDVTLALHYLAIGADRARRYGDGRRNARAGRVVIFDRFPLESLSSRLEHRLLDGPQISAALGDSTGRVTGALAAAEKRMYRRFALPDYLMVLQVSPEVSADRKPDHRIGVLTAKARAALELATLAETGGDPARVIRIDANGPFDAVLQVVKARLWNVL